MIRCNRGESSHGGNLFSDRAVARRSRLPVSTGGRPDFHRNALGQRRLLDVVDVLCHHPEYLAYAGGLLLVVAIGAKLGSLAS
jgi:hypothetical protein